jgi:hypothetical protein
MAIVANLGIPGYPIDQKFCSNNRTAATGAAVIALTPLYPGEVVMALDTGQRYMGLSLVAGQWGQIHGTIPHSGGDSSVSVSAGS